MRKSVQRIVNLGLLSHALAFSAMYVILSGLITRGSDYIPAFLGAALLMAGVAIYTFRDLGTDGRQRFFFLGLGVLVLGVAGLALIDASEMVAPLLLLVTLGLFMWRRMLYMIENIDYLRQALLDHYRLDVQLLVGFTVLTFFAGRDPGWEMRMLPFFIAFLVTRMAALSMASKLNNTTTSKQFGVSLANNMPFLFVTGVMFLTWMISVVGGPLDRLIATLLSPLFYAMGFLVQFVMGLFGDTIQKAWQQAGQIIGESQKNMPTEETVALEPGGYLIGDWFLYSLVALVVLMLIWYFYRQMKQMSRMQLSSGVIEVREFIHDEVQTVKWSPRTIFSGPLTPMRKTYRRFLLAMKKSGHLRAEGETASEYIKKVASQSPNLGPSMEELTEYYMRERYGAKSVEDKHQRAEQLTDELAQGREPS